MLRRGLNPYWHKTYGAAPLPPSGLVSLRRGIWSCPALTTNSGSSRGRSSTAAFDLFDDSETSREVIRRILAFLRFHLLA
jgi:hypothetical protein